jgi:hypothetical protein
MSEITLQLTNSYSLVAPFQRAALRTGPVVAALKGATQVHGRRAQLSRTVHVG